MLVIEENFSIKGKSDVKKSLKFTRNGPIISGMHLRVILYASLFADFEVSWD
jgi:hypothetical protein